MYIFLGEFKGYKIRTWTKETGKEKAREIIMKSDSTQALVQSFKPFATNYAEVYAFNGAYNGPASNRITIKTEEGKPGPVDQLECFPMGSSALLLAWEKTEEVKQQQKLKSHVVKKSGHVEFFTFSENVKLRPVLTTLAQFILG